MSENDLVTTETPAPSAAEAAPAEQAPTRRRGGLSGMVLAELRELAGRLGVPDIAGMRKGELIAAIKERQGGGAARPSDQLALADHVAGDAPAAASGSVEPATDRPAAAAGTNG
ncbi:MAG TPA: Rho termination factor N-terminal domain-containing protein, partial [Pseudonocardia sp.]|nr:Rho termination factor N-terminal domain-containing protein [Pseudonocardia sp.]